MTDLDLIGTHSVAAKGVNGLTLAPFKHCKGCCDVYYNDYMEDPHQSPPRSSRVRIDPDQTKHSLRVLDVPLLDCRANPHQPRTAFDPAGLQELATSIAQHGLLQPITVKRDPKNKQGYIVVAGERRFRAHELLQRPTIPAIITAGNADELALIENLQRENLNPIEEAEALERLRKRYDYTQDELARTVGKARSTITNLLRLTSLPRRIKKEGSTSNVATRSFLIELARLDDSKQQLELWQEAKERGVTVRAMRAKQPRKPSKAASHTHPTLSLGKRFVGELEQLAADDEPFSAERYEQLLDIFGRFVSLMEREAAKKPT